MGMLHTSAVTVSVPATTANIGPGFDCLGAALSLYNRFTFSKLDAAPGTVVIAARGAEAARVQTDASNLAYQAFARFFQHTQAVVPAVKIDIHLGVPLARGLGSSATAIVGGLVAAGALTGAGNIQDLVMQLAIAMEGHPDNVVPALLGGCRLAATTPDNGWEICELSWHEEVVPIVAIPDFELSTAAARRVLPSSYARADAIFNTAHLGLLIRGLETGKAPWLRAALHDRIHQPYRQALIPGYAAIHQTAMAAGAYGLVISGAGSTLLALAEAAQAEPVRAAISASWQAQGVEAEVQVVQLDRRGATVQVEPGSHSN
jgi:homoserine kinase